MRRLESRVVFLALIVGYLGTAGTSVNADSWQTSIEAVGTADVKVCVEPPTSYGGQYIIGPRCDNLNLDLVCGERTDIRKVKRILSPGRAVVISCPEEEGGLTDVVKLPIDPEPLCVTCPLPRDFDLSPGELGLSDGDAAAGKARNCEITGRYSTVGIVDLFPPSPDFSRQGPADQCRNDVGRIPLVAVDQAIEPVEVHFTFSDGADKPKINSGYENFPAGLDWSKKSPFAARKSPKKGEDQDGFETASEGSGFALAASMSLRSVNYPGHSATYIAACSSPSDPDRLACWHDNSQDLFATLRPLLASDSKFPDMNSTTALKWFFGSISAEASAEEGGLGIVVHPLEQPVGASRRVVKDTQKAVIVKEWDAGLELPITKKTNIVLGYSDFGTPNTAGVVDVYTRRIKQYICDLCGGTPKDSGDCDPPGYFGTEDCKSSASPADTGDALVRAYTRYVNQHEIGHSLFLVDDGDDHHHPPGDETLIMTPSPILTKRGSKVTFHLPYQFDASCRESKALE